MNKAILVIDMPKNCDECPCEDRDYPVCCVLNKERKCYAKRPNWCPLKPIPKRNKYDVEKYAIVDYENDITLGHYLNKGWNDCIDEILGDNKDE